MAGPVRRRLYKPERKPARRRGALYELAPVGCPDASPGEVAKAVFALAKEANAAIGQGSGYDPLRDEYTVIGKSLETGKAQDFKVQGEEVASVIRLARMLNGGPMHTRHERRTRKMAPTRLPGLPG